MEKSKLGVNVCLLGAVSYWITLFGGYVATLILAGYILLFEKNHWLKKTVLNSLVLSLFISLLVHTISILPDFVNLINSFFGIFEGHFYANGLTSFSSFLTIIVGIVKTITFIIMGFTSLKQKNITIPFVSKFVDKHFHEDVIEAVEEKSEVVVE